jgi:hypothetical protein
MAHYEWPAKFLERSINQPRGREEERKTND